VDIEPRTGGDRRPDVISVGSAHVVKVERRVHGPTGSATMTLHTGQEAAMLAPDIPEVRRRFVAVGVVAVSLLATACASSGSTASPPSSRRPTSTSTRSSSTTSSSSTTTTSSTTAPGTDAVLAAPLLPLFPFQTAAEAEAWRTAYRASGARPEFADAGRTAVAFAQFLGYTEIDRVVTTRTDAKGAHVSVGALIPDTDRTSTAAIVHLVRFTTGADAPWVVVGTDDTNFALTAPAYGRGIQSPLPVGGTITGVDESIRVHVQQLHGNGYLGEACCIPAGGQGSPWSGTLTFAPPTDPILMVSASTGGHIRGVERFTVNGVRAG
jgi:hypothetical protein